MDTSNYEIFDGYEQRLSECGNYKLKKIRLKNLIRFADSVAQGEWKGEVPITRARARVIANNPDGDPEDLALGIVEALDGACAAYSSVVVAVLRFKQSEVRVQMLSAGKVNFRHTRNRVFEMLMSIFQSEPKIVCATGNSPAVELAYRRANFIEYAPITAWKIKLGCLDTKLIVRKAIDKLSAVILRVSPPRSKSVLGEVRGVSPFLCLAAGLCFFTRRFRERVPLSLPAEELWPDDGGSDRFVRKPKTINWILNSKWWGEEAQQTAVENRYNFSANGQSVTYRVFDLLGRGGTKPVGWAVLSIVASNNRTVVKVQDHFMSSSAASKQVAELALKIGLDLKADAVLIPPSGKTGWRWLTLGRISVPFRPTYFFSVPPSVDGAGLDQISTSLADGDTGFW